MFKTSVSTGAVKDWGHQRLFKTLNDAGVNAVSLNLTPIMDKVLTPFEMKRLLKDAEISCQLLEGGWCDFFLGEEKYSETKHNLSMQLQALDQLEVQNIRLFWGREPDISEALNRVPIVVDRVGELLSKNGQFNFYFENCVGASNNAVLLCELMKGLDLPNIGLNFDTVNFEVNNENPFKAFDQLQNYIRHIHVKGKMKDRYAAYGVGDSVIDLIVKQALSEIEDVSFGVEYEGDSADKMGELVASFRRFQERFSDAII